MTNLDAYTTYFDKPVVLSPPRYIDTLNSDVLLQIFELFISCEGSNEEAPVILSKVSPTWRNLIINTPALWAQIRIHETLRASKKHTTFRRALRRVHYFLEKSQQCPLSLDIIFQTRYKRATSMYDENHPRKPYVSGFRNCTLQLSRILGPHVARFAEFRVRADEAIPITDIERYLPRVPMPLLTYWRVSQNASHIVLDPHPAYINTPFCLSTLLRPDDAANDWGTHMYPNLRRVRLVSIQMNWDNFSPTNLTSLSLSLLPYSARPTAPVLHAFLLASAPTLEILDLDGCVRLDTPEAPYTPFTLPHVHALKLGYRFAQELISLLEVLHLPSLRSLALTDHHQRLRHRPGARTPRFDCKISPLLRTLTAHLPLAQITRLMLHHIRFLPPSAHECAALGDEFASVRNAHGSFIPAALFAFLAALTGLSTLVLTDPDHALLDALSYAPPTLTRSPAPQPPAAHAAGEAQASPGTLPVPRLASLRLTAFNIFVVRNYLIFRHMSGRPPLATLELGMPVAWLGSKHLLLAAKVAHVTEVVPVVLRRAVEADLWREVDVGC